MYVSHSVYRMLVSQILSHAFFHWHMHICSVIEYLWSVYLTVSSKCVAWTKRMNGEKKTHRNRRAKSIFYWYSTIHKYSTIIGLYSLERVKNSLKRHKEINMKISQSVTYLSNVNAWTRDFNANRKLTQNWCVTSSSTVICVNNTN